MYIRLGKPLRPRNDVCMYTHTYTYTYQKRRNAQAFAARLGKPLRPRNHSGTHADHSHSGNTGIWSFIYHQIEHKKGMRPPRPSYCKKIHKYVCACAYLCECQYGQLIPRNLVEIYTGNIPYLSSSLGCSRAIWKYSNNAAYNNSSSEHTYACVFLHMYANADIHDIVS